MVILQALLGIAILIGFYGAGVLIEACLPIPLPANIIGLLLLFLALRTKLIKLAWVESLAQLGLRHMGLFFIPAIVGASVLLPEIEANWWSVGTVWVVSTLLVMAVTGLVTKYWRRRGEESDD